MNEDIKEWKKAEGSSDAWFFIDTEKRLECVLRASKADPHLPLELRSWRASAAFERVLGHIPKGVLAEEEVYDDEGVTLYVASRMSNDLSPWKRFHFPCVLLPSAMPSMEREFVPVPFQMCLVAYQWMKHSGLTAEDVSDWRSTKYRWVIRCQPALRNIFTAKKRKLDSTRFGLNYMASDHALSPIEAALLRWIYENDGPRLVIPPSFRDPVWALNKENDKKDRVDAFRYLYPEIDQEVEQWERTSLWKGLITEPEKLSLQE
jgi:hypothetical protein